MRERVAFLLSLLSGRPFLLLDEPFASLVAITRAEMQSLLAGLLQTDDHTVLLVTHEPDIAAYAGRLIVFRDGDIIRDERNASPLRAASELEKIPPAGRIA